MNQIDKFTLLVRQQPMRARMCGLGDKDRRQISPPPCVELIITDENGARRDVENYDISTLILIAEIYSIDEQKNLSIIKSANSIISGLDSSSVAPEAGDSDGDTDTGSRDQPTHDDLSTTYININDDNHSNPIRNLIGNVVSNAVKLYDDNRRKGIWFIMHDLSIRVEGEFKLKFSLFDLKSSINARIVDIKREEDDETAVKHDDDDDDEAEDDADSSPFSHFNCLTHVFSESFKVFSAKKFPGVTESSDLSKTFASQGIKIPIRRDTKDKDDDYD